MRAFRITFVTVSMLSLPALVLAQAPAEPKAQARPDE